MVLIYEDEYDIEYPNPFARHIVAVDTLSRRLDPATGTLTSERLVLKRGKLPKWAPRDVLGTRGGVGPSSYVLETIRVKATQGGGQKAQIAHSDETESSSLTAVSRDGWGWGWGWGSKKEVKPEEQPILPEPLDPGTVSASDSVSFFMQSVTRNIDHRKMMEVTEIQSFAPRHHDLFRDELKKDAQTQCQLIASFGSQFGWGLTERVERFGMNRFVKQVHHSRAGLQHVIDRLKELSARRTSIISNVELDLDWGRRLSDVGLMSDPNHRPWRFSSP